MLDTYFFFMVSWFLRSSRRKSWHCFFFSSIVGGPPSTDKKISLLSCKCLKNKKFLSFNEQQISSSSSKGKNYFFPKLSMTNEKMIKTFWFFFFCFLVNYPLISLCVYIWFLYYLLSNVKGELGYALQWKELCQLLIHVTLNWDSHFRFNFQT